MGVEGLLGVLGVSSLDLLLLDLRMTSGNRHVDIRRINHSRRVGFQMFPQVWMLASNSHKQVLLIILCFFFFF